jgi:hypothetical protein
MGKKARIIAEKREKSRDINDEEPFDIANNPFYQNAVKIYGEKPFTFGVKFNRTENKGQFDVKIMKTKYMQIIHPNIEVTGDVFMKAVFAKEPIKAGTTLVVETPFLRFIGRNEKEHRLDISRYADWMSRTKGIVTILRSRVAELFPRRPFETVRELSKELQESAKMAEGYADDVAMNYLKIARNAFAHKDCHNIYSFTSNINHACIPNADWEIYSENGFHNIIKITALEDIPAQKEIVIRYFPPVVMQVFNKEERIKAIEDGFGFICKCNACHVKEDLPPSNQCEGQKEQMQESQDHPVS